MRRHKIELKKYKIMGKSPTGSIFVIDETNKGILEATNIMWGYILKFTNWKYHVE